jgi:hypothetical protein
MAQETVKEEPKESNTTKDAREDGNAFGQFKDAESLYEGYKNVQGWATRVSQENKELKAQMDQLKTQFEDLSSNAQSQTSTQEYHAPNVAYENLVDNPGQTIDDIVGARLVTETLQELEEENPKDFQERYQFASWLSRQPQYQSLAKSGRGVKKLFKLGDKLREQQLRQNAHRSLEMILGEPVDDQAIERFKGVLKPSKQSNNQNNTDAYMPDSTTSAHRPGPESGQNRDFSRAKSEAAEKGDVDGAIFATFQEALSK